MSSTLWAITGIDPEIKKRVLVFEVFALSKADAEDSLCIAHEMGYSKPKVSPSKVGVQ